MNASQKKHITAQEAYELFLKVTSPGFLFLCKLLKSGKKDNEALNIVHFKYGMTFNLDDCKIIREGIEKGYM